MTLLRFSCGKGLISWIVQQRTGCWASHCDFVLPSNKLLGALPGGGVQERDRLAGETRFALYELPIENGWKYAQTQIGTPYDYWAVVGMGIPFPRDWHNDKFWYCSELVAKSLLEAGLPIVNPEIFGVTPRDLLMSPLLKRVD